MNTASASSPRFVELSYANAEALKWIAFACMLVDHANVVFAARAWEWATPVGRIAMPVFALLVARHLDNPRVMNRLAIFGLIACAPYAFALHGGEPLPLNILLTFWLAGVVLFLFRQGNPWLSAAAFLFGGLFVEYSLPGVALVLAAWCWWRYRGSLPLLCLFVALALLCTVNGNAWGFLSVPVVLAVSAFDLQCPRARWLFWIGYPAHLAVLALLATFVVRV